jgi:putative tryptophan/tyrosine transport system substrate-binding protein
LVPKAAVIGLLVNPSNTTAEAATNDLQAAAEELGHKLTVVKASTGGDIDAAFGTLVQLRVGGLIIYADAFFTSRRVQLATLVARHAIPTIYPSREFALAGGLMSYSSNIADAYREMGVYTGRILKGAKPSDLPVMQPTQVEFVINLNTAKALGVTIPPGVLAIADEVIE